MIGLAWVWCLPLSQKAVTRGTIPKIQAARTPLWCVGRTAISGDTRQLTQSDRSRVSSQKMLAGNSNNSNYTITPSGAVPQTQIRSLSCSQRYSVPPATLAAGPLCPGLSAQQLAGGSGFSFACFTVEAKPRAGT